MESTSKHPIVENELKRRRSPKRTEYVTKDGEVKVLVSFLLNKSLYEEFKVKAYELYGPGRGALSKCLEDVLRSWLVKCNPGETNVKVEHVWRKVLEVLAQLRETSVSGLEGGEVLEKHLVRAIAKVRGSDPRTIKKWLQLFEVNGFIEYKTGFTPNRVYRIKRVVYGEK